MNKPTENQVNILRDIYNALYENKKRATTIHKMLGETSAERVLDAFNKLLSALGLNQQTVAQHQSSGFQNMLRLVQNYEQLPGNQRRHLAPAFREQTLVHTKFTESPTYNSLVCARGELARGNMKPIYLWCKEHIESLEKESYETI